MNKKKDTTSFLEYILLFFTGFVALSTYANVVLKYIGIYFIEILIMPLVFYYIVLQKKQFNYRIFFYLKIHELFILLFLVTSIVIGVINTGSVFSTVTCVRPYIYLLLIIKYIRDSHLELSLINLYVLSFGCICGDLIYTLQYSTLVVERGYQHINTIAVALIVIIPIIRRRLFIGILSSAFAVCVALMSGYRINLLVCIVAIISSLCFMTITSRKIVHKTKYIFVILVGGMVVLWTVNNFEIVAIFLTDKLKMSSLTVYRSLDRISGLLNNDLTTGDKNRLAGFMVPFQRFFINILPSGPIGKSNLSHFGEYTDKPILFLYDIYGSFLSWVMVFCYAAFMLSKAKKLLVNIKYKMTSEYNCLFIVMLPIILVLFILNGTFFTFVNISILYALAIGGCVSSSKEIQYEFLRER